MARELTDLFARGNIPQSGGHVLASSDDHCGVRRESRTADRRCMSGKLAKLFPCCHVPQSRRGVLAACEQKFAVG